MDPESHLPLPPRTLLILAVLAEGPLHGYGILTEVEERSRSGVTLDAANLYRALRRMRADGWVEEVDEPDPEDPRRRLFRVTPLGRSIVEAEVARLQNVLSWVRPAQA